MPRDPRRRIDHFTDEDLDRMAQITPEDLARARAWWEDGAPAEFRGLLDAAEDAGDTLTGETRTDGPTL